MYIVNSVSKRTILVDFGGGYKAPYLVVVFEDYSDDGTTVKSWNMSNAFSGSGALFEEFLRGSVSTVQIINATIQNWDIEWPYDTQYGYEYYGTNEVTSRVTVRYQESIIPCLYYNNVAYGFGRDQAPSVSYDRIALSIPYIVYDKIRDKYMISQSGGYNVGPYYMTPEGTKLSDTGITSAISKGKIPYMELSSPYPGSSFTTYLTVNLSSAPDALQTLFASSPYISDDPYDPGGRSGTGGGTGTFSDTGDSVDFPALPTLNAVDTGFITLYNPTLAELQDLASYMWSELFDLDTFRKILADPMDAILGLSIVPVAVPDGGSQSVTVGNISTGVSMNKAASQYVEVDCGSLSIKEFWGAYLDYDPFTKAELYLPYCGTHAIAVDDIMGKTVHIKYHVDILSGACCCYVKCGESVLYTFVGQCSSSIPVSAGDYTNVINGIITVAASVGSLVATGGASAPTAIPALASTAVNSMKPTIEKSGSMSGTGGMLAVQTPYLIVTRPKQALPTDQNTFTGYPSFINEKLSDLSGFTQIEEIRLTGMSASDAEITEIETLLKTGVIF